MLPEENGNLSRARLDSIKLFQSCALRLSVTTLTVFFTLKHPYLFPRLAEIEDESLPKDVVTSALEKRVYFAKKQFSRNFSQEDEKRNVFKFGLRHHAAENKCINWLKPRLWNRVSALEM
jgi:hypothetical protein